MAKPDPCSHASPLGVLWANLITVVFEACDLAAEGLIADGYQVLLIGKQRALEGEPNFEPWSEELEGRWDAAMEKFAARWSVGRG